MNAVNELIRTPDENPTIGLLICKDKDQTEVQWAFQGIQTPMRVASYDNIKLEEIKKQLPTEEQFYQFPEPFYQLLNFTDFDVKIRRDFR